MVLILEKLLFLYFLINNSKIEKVFIFHLSLVLFVHTGGFFSNFNFTNLKKIENLFHDLDKNILNLD
jgi:hypothetical protein